MTMQITMTQTRMGESGSLLTAGSTYTVSKAFGAAMVGNGYATDTAGVLRPDSTEFSPSERTAIKAVVSGAGNLATSRAALAADNGATLELANGVTYTLTDAVALPAGVIWIGPASGSAVVAVTGSATINGGTTSITIAAGEVYSGLPRATNPAAFVVKGG